MLELNNATLLVDGHEVCHGLSLMAHDGQLTCITGPVGSGKTAVLWALMGLLPLAEGYVTVDGEWLNHLSAPAFRRTMAYLAQERPSAAPAASDWWADGGADEAAWAPGRAERVGQLPPVEDERTLLLSDEKRIVLADEPSPTMLASLTTLAREGRTVVVASREPAFLNLADRVVSLGPGE